MRGALDRLSYFMEGRDFSKAEATELNGNGDCAHCGGDAKAECPWPLLGRQNFYLDLNL